MVLDHDCRVHPLVLDGHPQAAAAHERLVVGRGVEVVGGAAVAIGRDEVRVLDARNAAPQRDQLFEQLRQVAGLARGHAHRDEGRLVVGAPDPEVEHLERAVVAHHRVEHRVEQLRIDQVAFGFDDLGRGGHVSG